MKPRGIWLKPPYFKMKYGVYITIGIAAIIIIVLGSIQDVLISDSVNTFSATDTVTTVAANGTINLANFPVTTDSETVTLNSSELTKDSDYTITDATGVIILQGQAPGDYNGQVSYRYEKGEYLQLNPTRVTVRYAPTLFLLSLLVFVVGYTYFSYKKK